MKELLNPVIILILFVLLYSVDIVVALTPGVRRIAYAILGVLALIYLIIALIVH